MFVLPESSGWKGTQRVRDYRECLKSDTTKRAAEKRMTHVLSDVCHRSVLTLTLFVFSPRSLNWWNQKRTGVVSLVLEPKMSHHHIWMNCEASTETPHNPSPPNFSIRTTLYCNFLFAKSCCTDKHSELPITTTAGDCVPKVDERQEKHKETLGHHV